MAVDVHSVSELEAADWDNLPFGLISVDEDARIEHYNTFESKMARLPKERVVGRNFFRDVAPCAAVQEFQGRFERFVQGGGDKAESFDFTFRFAFGLQHVSITFLRSAKSKKIMILINRYDD